MPAEFLKRLPLTDDEAKKLANLGASTPLALLEMRKAAPDDFDAFIGEERARVIVEALENLLTRDERERLTRPQPRREFPLGARLDAPARLPPTPGDSTECGRLRARIQELRRLPDTSETRHEIALLEAELDKLVKS